jgi:rare lipoprotein A
VRATTPALLSGPSGQDAARHERYVAAHTATPRKPTGQYLEGDASFYANFFSGRLTANGERYDPRKLTAANRTLPFGTRLRVTRLDTGRSVTVTVNDRGPFGKRRRILDLSRAAAEQLDMIRVGHTEVRAEILD